MKIKAKKLLSLLSAIVVLLLVTIGITLYFVSEVFAKEFAAIVFYPYTLNSNFFLAISTLIFVIVSIVCMVKEKELPQWVMQLKLAATTCISVTLFTVIFFLAPLWNITNDNVIAYQNFNLFFHLLAPIVAILSFIFFDTDTKIKWRWTWCAILPTLIYGLSYLTLVLSTSDITYDIYNFAHNGTSSDIDITRALIFIAIMFGGTYALANLWWALNLTSYKISHREKKVKETGVMVKTVESEPKVEAVIVKPHSVTKVKVSKSSGNLYNGGVRTYHISTSKSLLGKWQVKLAGGEKAIKVFPTQLEAIEYTRELVKTQGGSIRLHSLDGRIRKI